MASGFSSQLRLIMALLVHVGILFVDAKSSLGEGSRDLEGDSDAAVSYDRQVRPILAEFCFPCHGFDRASRQADLRLDIREGAVDVGSHAVVPGNPEASQLIQRINADDVYDVMPPPESKKHLTVQQKLVLRKWIQQGAEYDQHWAFVGPQDNLPPEFTSDHPIDSFIQSALKEKGIQPSPLAAPETLIRRVSLDLTGLPPSPEEVDQFIFGWSRSPEVAYSELVDRLLASPHHGERFGRWWLDQARYADSNGYSIDAPREIWLYRDWVVQALNSDMPFDQFTIQQIAGDLLPGADLHKQIATGFHRNTQINKEGGIDPEQFRIESVFDRVATTGTVWLGLTIGCAQCHDHKYDAITQEDYYRLFAFFNNQDEPTLKVIRTHDGQIHNAEAQTTDTETDKAKLGTDGSLQDNQESGSSSVDSHTTLVMRERRSPRETHVLIKGDFTRPDAVVTPGTPGILHPFHTGSESPNRLDLALWIVDRGNPLTSRVVVNRVWQHYFGRGLVETENDFGAQGTLPSHAELLDWLAVYWVESGWSLKQLHRLIVTSHTYRQSSVNRPELEQTDPTNLLLARQTRLRLDAELIRDVALSVSGLLNTELGGPPVYPPIPEGVMQLGQVHHKWSTSEGAERYRRALYTFVFRATPFPALNVFDAPDGFQSCTRRNRSNTPLQALTLLNDKGFFEFAQALAERIERLGLATSFRHCLSRHPSQKELELLKELDPLSAARVLVNLDETITRE